MHLPRPALPLLAIALLSACTNEIWLSEPDADVDAGRDASIVPRDANDLDSGVDSGIEIDAGPPPVRGCEIASVTIGPVSTTDPLEMPTFAVSGRLATLRYGVLVPPSASVTATDDTRLIVLDADGALLHERPIRLDDASGTATSAATLHSFSPLTADEGFLLLAPQGIWMLDADGAGATATATLVTAPSTVWQRAAGWIDADRFVFVSDTPDLLLAVFDRRTGEVTTTSISAMNAAAVHLEAGGATLSSAILSEVVVYDPDLSGAETLRLTWGDPTLLGSRLIGVGFFSGERTWVVHDPSEFRTNTTSYRISPGEAPIGGVTTAMLGPLTATREGPFLAITSQNPWLALYAFETHTFSTVAMDFVEVPIVEDERDGENVSILFFEPAEAGAQTLALACGRQ